MAVTRRTGNGIMLNALMPDEYDVFLSYSSVDKPAVEAVAVRLRDEARLRPFLDKWHLVPGESWMPSLEQALERSTTVAVFFGPHGRGAWQDHEAQLALVLAAEERGKRVIPVLLPRASKDAVGGFMRLRTWVKLVEEGGFAALVAGVTGRAPGPSVGSPQGTGRESPPVRPSPFAAGDERASELDRPFVDNRGANIGQMVVQGSAAFGSTTDIMPSSAPSAGDGADQERGSAPAGSPRARELTADDVEQLISALSEVFNNAGEARLLARKAGFPPNDLPTFRTARLFWNVVVQALVDGKTGGGVAALAAAAAKLYPANAVFGGFGGRGGPASHPPHTPSGRARRSLGMDSRQVDVVGEHDAPSTLPRMPPQKLTSTRPSAVTTVSVEPRSVDSLSNRLFVAGTVTLFITVGLVVWALALQSPPKDRQQGKRPLTDGVTDIGDETLSGSPRTPHDPRNDLNPNSRTPPRPRNTKPTDKRASPINEGTTPQSVPETEPAPVVTTSQPRWTVTKVEAAGPTAYGTLVLKGPKVPAPGVLQSKNGAMCRVGHLSASETRCLLTAEHVVKPGDVFRAGSTAPPSD